MLLYAVLTIDFPRLYSEVQIEDVAIALFIKRLVDEDAGNYTCQATYAGNKHLSSSVSISTIRKLLTSFLNTAHQYWTIIFSWDNLG